MSNVPQNIVELGLTSYDTFRSYNDTKTLLINNLKSLPNWDEIDKTFQGSGTLELIVHLISVSNEIQSFMNLRGVQESYIEFAQISDNIYAKARELGYRINRPTCPTVVVEYTGVPTYSLAQGTVVGTLGDLDLVYFGATKLVEQGDHIVFCVGKYTETLVSFDSSDYVNSLVTVMSPTLLSAIDNDKLSLVYNGVVATKTIFPEDYIVFEKYADFSNSTTESKLFIADFKLRHGLANLLESSLSRSITTQFIETNGKVSSININDIKMIPLWRPVQVDGLGTTSDSPASIVKNAPLVYSLMRRAITETDFIFLHNSLPQIKSSSVIPFGDVAGVYQVTANTLATNNYVTINSLVYAYQNLDNISNNAVLQILYKALRNDPNISVQLDATTADHKILIYSESPRLLLSIDVSSNLTLTTVTPQVKSKPCVLMVKYVGHNTVTDPVYLTPTEYADVSNVVNYYKPIGLTLLYEHATRKDVSLKYAISLSNNTDRTLISTLINNVISSYDYSIDVTIDSGEILRIIERYCNSKYGTVSGSGATRPDSVIQYSIDDSPISVYVDKSHYCKLSCTLTFI